MKRPVIYLLGLTLLLTKTSTLAQPDTSRSAPNPTVIGLIRVTLEFLATDTKAFGKVPNPVCQPCNTYEELTAFAKKNHLSGADELVNDTRNQAKKALAANPATMPAALRAYLLDRVAGGNRSKRKELPTFAAFEQRLNAVTTGKQPDEAVPALSDEADMADTTTITDAPASAENSTLAQSSTTQKSFSIMDYLPLILSLLSLAGVVLLWMRGRSVNKSTQPGADSEMADILARMKGLEAQNRKLSDRLMSLEKTNQPRTSPQQESGSRPQPVQPRVPAPEPAPPVAEPIPATPAPPVPAPNTFRAAQQPTLFYGRTADLGDGFSISSLSTNLDRDTVFEIHRQTDTQALFQVSDQPDLQRLALSDPYSYLNDTCSYQMQPRPGSRIRTEKPGKLSLQGDKWAIVEKAQISFIS